MAAPVASGDSGGSASIMVVLASFQHVIGMARQNSAKPDSLLKSKSSTASYPLQTLPLLLIIQFFLVSTKI
jgi:hypothetical protein